MERNLQIYDSPQNLNDLANHNYEEQPFFIVTGDIVDCGFDAEPLEDYELPEGFPNCCAYHAGVLSNARDWFSRFPNCCEGHKQLLAKRWFDKATYSNIPEKITKQVAYTSYHIETKINNPDWYKDITDYIEYMLASFGSPSVGGERYIANIKNYIENGKLDFLTAFKRNRILEYINQFYNEKEPENKSKTDLNILYRTFQKWLKIIPNIDAFTQLKQRLTNKMPMNIMAYDVSFNPYLGVSKFKVKTQGELVEWLSEFTTETLGSIDTVELVKSGVISDFNKYQFEVTSEGHKLAQNRLLGKFSDGELGYIDVIDKWLSNESAYFGKIKEYVNNELIAKKRGGKKAPVKIKILFLSANPIDTAPLRLEDELRRIKDEMQMSTNRDLLELTSESAVKIQTITRVLQQRKPRIVHFSGHGSGENGLAVQDEVGSAVLFPTLGLVLSQGNQLTKH